MKIEFRYPKLFYKLQEFYNKLVELKYKDMIRFLGDSKEWKNVTMEQYSFFRLYDMQLEKIAKYMMCIAPEIIATGLTEEEFKKVRIK